MSRLQFKGGPWTNAEDQVLKAALAQYGLRDWERVASMLTKKTAAQCRERWENFLDPRLNLDAPWSPDEEEQLLELQSLFANQWRLIAGQLTARTATHYRRPAWLCEQKYLELRDLFELEKKKQQQQQEPGEAEFSIHDFLAERRRGRAARRAHEEKPARPDTVDGEHHEEEMLTMAVARLANQDQKKGLRKERQRQLAEASFLAKLESNREAVESGTLSLRQEKRMRRALEEDQHFRRRIEGADEKEAQSDIEEAFGPIDVLEDQSRARVERKPRSLLVDLTGQQRHIARATVTQDGAEEDTRIGVQLGRLRAIPAAPTLLTLEVGTAAQKSIQSKELTKTAETSKLKGPHRPGAAPLQTGAVTWEGLLAPSTAAPDLDALFDQLDQMTEKTEGLANSHEEGRGPSKNDESATTEARTTTEEGKQEQEPSCSSMEDFGENEPPLEGARDPTRVSTTIAQPLCSATVETSEATEWERAFAAARVRVTEETAKLIEKTKRRKLTDTEEEGKEDITRKTITAAKALVTAHQQQNATQRAEELRDLTRSLQERALAEKAGSEVCGTAALAALTDAVTAQQSCLRERCAAMHRRMESIAVQCFLQPSDRLAGFIEYDKSAAARVGWRIEHLQRAAARACSDADAKVRFLVVLREKESALMRERLEEATGQLRKLEEVEANLQARFLELHQRGRVEHL